MAPSIGDVQRIRVTVVLVTDLEDAQDAAKQRTVS
jgi:hypothetical protein